MTELIGFIGVIGSGKTHQRDMLVKKGFIALDFKDELIDMCEDLIGYKVRENYDKFKLSIVGMEPLNPNEYTRAYPLAMTGRRLLQRMGTEVMRKRDPDYWVKAWARRATEYVKGGFSVSCADIRFRNEIGAFWKLGDELGVPAKILFCDYHSPQYNSTSPHESELLARTLVMRGLKDLQEVQYRDIADL